MSFLAGSRWVEPPDGDQDQAEVADPVQEPVRGGLIGDRAGDDRLAVVTVDLEAPEPGRPVPVEDPLDAKSRSALTAPRRSRSDTL
jgi:hypothetical protein